MGKKYVPLQRNLKTYKLYVNDIHKCYQYQKKSTPKIPTYYEDYQSQIKYGSTTPITLSDNSSSDFIQQDLMFQPIEIQPFESN